MNQEKLKINCHLSYSAKVQVPDCPPSSLGLEVTLSNSTSSSDPTPTPGFPLPGRMHVLTPSSEPTYPLFSQWAYPHTICICILFPFVEQKVLRAGNSIRIPEFLVNTEHGPQSSVKTSFLRDEGEVSQRAHYSWLAVPTPLTADVLSVCFRFCKHHLLQAIFLTAPD